MSNGRFRLQAGALLACAVLCIWLGARRPQLPKAQEARWNLPPRRQGTQDVPLR
jgi:hypothetical protein